MSSRSMLHIHNLHVRVGETEIIKGLSLDVPAGEVHAIMGPNGAGKSTLSSLLAGRRGAGRRPQPGRREPAWPRPERARGEGRLPVVPVPAGDPRRAGPDLSA